MDETNFKMELSMTWSNYLTHSFLSMVFNLAGE